MFRSVLKQRTRTVVIAIIAVLVVPYAFSRLASRWRCVAIHALPNPSSDQVETDAIRVASYNIAHGRGLAVSNWEGGSRSERETRLEEIADLLQTIDADIVVLNEVDFDSSWSHSRNQAETLAKRAGYPFWVEQRNLDFRVLVWKWRFGNAILSKYPIIEADVVDVPGFSTAESIFAGKKRCVHCMIDVGGKQIRVIGAHLSHRSESIRVQSADVIAKMVASGSVPTIVAGDLNSTPAGFPDSRTDEAGGNALDRLDTSKLLQRRPIQPPQSSTELTFHSTEPKSLIDWVLVPQDWQFVDYQVALSELSDHRPVVADLLMTPRSAGDAEQEREDAGESER